MNKGPRTIGSRHGVTIVEVLTSIIVAVIGVAGVLVLIPFGIRQAETGLDIDSATTVAENAIAEFQIEGYGRASLFNGQIALPWIDVLAQSVNPRPVQLLNDSSSEPVGTYWIDPMWLSRFSPGGVYPTQAKINALFNSVTDINFNSGIPGGFSDGTDVPAFQPRMVQLMSMAVPFDFNGLPNPMSSAAAEQMFMCEDELQFAVKTDPATGIEMDDLSPPRPYLDLGPDINGDGVPDAMRRQYRGSITWSAVAVPRWKTGELNLASGNTAVQRMEGFDFHVLVYKERKFTDPENFPDTDSDPRFLHAKVVNGGNLQTIYGTGTITLESGVDIRNDEWVMLINYDLNHRAQVGFFRTIGSDPNRSAITLEGSDFTIMDFDGNGNPNRSTTYAVYLRDVIAVFKRQVTMEGESGPNHL